MTATPPALTQRLRPLRVAVVLAGIAPWLPVEKVFMTQLGFTPALVATMAAAYAAVVPLLEIPSGILADRWSRRGVLMIANAAALASVAVAAISQNVVTYIVSALILGAYFALQSGTLDAIVYDTLLEELGSADDFERHYGRIQLLGSAALTASALAGGVLATLVSARFTYIITIPPQLLAMVALCRFREPTLHRGRERSGVREHIATTWRAVAGQPRIASIAVAMMLGAATLQMLFEFGPLWLITLTVPTFVFGPYTAGMTSALGLGGLVAERLRLDRPAVATAIGVAMLLCALTLTTTAGAELVITAQILLAVVLVAVGIHLSKRLHDAVPSSVRTGVSSGVGTLSWLTFLPCSLLFGAASSDGVRAAGWIILVPVAVAATLLVRISQRTHQSPCREPAVATA